MSQKDYSKDMFKLVQENERLLDKPLKTKQLTYFQDAMIRFTKNKYNVIATVILVIFILMSIFTPIITPKELYTQTNSTLTTLPPRVPLLEKIGILDGSKEFKDQPIDYDTIDPETGLGYPTTGFQVDFIQMNTLTNSIIIGSERDAKYVGGTNDLYVNVDKNAYSIVSPAQISFFTGYYIEVDINALETNGVLNVYLATSNLSNTYTDWSELTFLGTIDQEGVSTINPMDTVANGTTAFLVFKHELPAISSDGDELISFNSIAVKDSTGTDIEFFDGYVLSTFELFAIPNGLENGRYLRKNAEMTVATFRYDMYSALFADKPRTIGEVEYLRILSENPGMEDTIVLDDETPDTAWTFGEGFPLTAVTDIDRIKIGPTWYTNYKVMMNGAYELGFETTPYFLFGTNVFGQDLFTLIWLGLRTSLLLGFMAALVNIIVGVIWGATSAYYGGQVDILMERFTDIWGSFPQITMIGIITVLIGPGFTALFIFMVYDGWIGAAKITRSQFYRYKGREYVLAARTLGASDRRIIFKHILPNALGTIITRVILSIPSVIFLEVNLSFLGFGIGNGQALKIGPITLTGTSIGVILNDGQQQIFAGNLWLVIFPTIITSILMITFNMFGNALRDALNPQLRGS
ncbi:MAG: ABC transporter permease [Acholeplasma sp.]|jgi:ABC-type dipeptide/oligopeptide/nickel transport system permease subunit|nr:MAG: ABC transporter permease [Acholeplasma sp.]